MFAAFHERRCEKWKNLINLYAGGADNCLRLDVQSAQDLYVTKPPPIMGGLLIISTEDLDSEASFKMHLSWQWEFTAFGRGQEILELQYCGWSNGSGCNGVFSEILCDKSRLKALVNLLGGVEKSVGVIIGSMAHALLNEKGAR
eukprot:CAMPEP_0113303438 /NCGR_PEP_ID=MMETSP0010_2-20120614/3855_1 /TAXON_ID=216773 ORGANISM="Corethron hystrix, Strain 308" /NCGR_SAMPLE_ID=MMETSP0010_2 /ASSEMBLY_ACC=CAM_ASM_000155 /LENGTH=143 /DNA_ID=CAMNT_0000157437 /DNA_START=392 /DNA_END=823 /DNA_ORIENTATION=- /assembly_acc=CAM_ASM_000155